MNTKNIFIIFLIFVLFCSIGASSAIELQNSSLSQQNSISNQEYVNVENSDFSLGYSDEINAVELDLDNEISNADDYEIWVGNNITEDGGNGSYENPFSTLELACNNVNGQKKVTVNIFNGTYYLGAYLKFNTSNLNINGLGDVVIKNMYNKKAKNIPQAFGLTEPSSNFTFSNLKFDFSGYTVDNFPKNNMYYYPFYGTANLGVFYNCSFIGLDKNAGVTGSAYNSKWINCYFDKELTSKKLFKDHFDTNSIHTFEYCIFNVGASGFGTIHLPCTIDINNIWFGKNYIASPSTVVNPDGTYNTTWSFPVNRYAIFSVFENYLGENQYEIIGKLTWNGTDNQDGMENFQPMTVNLVSATGDINQTATLVNGNFRTIYTSSNSTHKVTATLHYEEIELEFTKVNITANPVSIYYGDNQNITFNFTQPITANVTVTVSNGSYNKSEKVEVIGKDSFIYTVPDTLKEGIYDVEINLAENNLFGFNTTTLTVSKVSDYTFEVATGDVKVGDNATISITLPDDVTGTVTVKFGNDTKELPANQTMTVNFTNLNATTYGVNVSYRGNDKYVALNKSASVTVNKADSVLEIEDAAFTYGDVIAIPFNVTNANGVTVSVLNKDDDEVANTSSESGTINLDTLPAGKYTLEATTIVGSNYEWVSKTIDLTINKANSSLDIQDKEFTYAAEAVINAVCENSTGNVIATLTDENNIEIAVTVSGDNITLPKLNTGKYTLTVTTNPDENHTNITKTATITINKAAPSMNVIVEPVENITTKDDVTLTISLPSDATGEVTVKINGKKTDSKSANETITINLNNKVGDYVVDVTYSGDKNYESDSATEEFTISKAETSITAKQIDFEEGNASKIEVTVPDVDSGIVLIDVAGKKFYGDIDGAKAVITLEGVDAGNYTANVKFFGDDKYNQATTTADVKVSEDKIITELKEHLKEAQANATQLKEDLDVANGKVENLTTQLNVTQANATQLKEDLDVANGKVENLTTQLNVTQANVTKLAEDLDVANGKVENLTTELADALNVVKLGSQFNVTDGTTFETYAVETGAGEQGALYAFVLRDSNGNPIANATVTFAYKTVVFNSTTDENGTLYLGISTYLAQDALCAMSYVGDETHNATFVAFNFKIQKKTTTITAAAKTYKATKKNKYLTVSLKTIKGASRDGKTYLKKGKKITLTVNGQTYVGYTKANGKVTFKITNLNKKGKYTAVIKFAGSDTYTNAKTKVKLKVY